MISKNNKNQEKQLLRDKTYMKMAIVLSELSHAIRNKVGCIIVSTDGQIISQGYNGTPSGFDNCCEYKNELGELVTKKEVLHAESNAISKCAKQTTSTLGATMYITLSPCFECSKLIIQSGIKRVCYLQNYRNEDGINLLKKANIIVDKIEI